MSGSENYAIRLALPEDIEQIKALGEQLLRSDRTVDPTITASSLFAIPGREQTLREQVAAQGNTRLCIVAEIQKSTIVGYSTGRILPGGTLRAATSAMLETICVATEYRRQGVGTLLASRVIEWAADSGAVYLELNVLAGNEQALQFYRHLGLLPARYTLRVMLGANN